MSLTIGTVVAMTRNEKINVQIGSAILYSGWNNFNNHVKKNLNMNDLKIAENYLKVNDDSSY